MAHSSNNDLTSKCLDAYPLPTMQEYNSYLLKIPPKVNSKEDLLKILKEMSEEERAALMAEAAKQVITWHNLAKKWKMHQHTMSKNGISRQKQG